MVVLIRLIANDFESDLLHPEFEEVEVEGEDDEYYLGSAHVFLFNTTTEKWVTH